MSVKMDHTPRRRSRTRLSTLIALPVAALLTSALFSNPASGAVADEPGTPMQGLLRGNAWSAFSVGSNIGTAKSKRLEVDQVARQFLAIGSDGFLYHQLKRADGTYTGFAQVPGYNWHNFAAREASITRLRLGGDEVVAIGEHGTVLDTIRYENGAWQLWEPLDGSPAMAATDVALAPDGDGGSWLYVIGSDGVLYERHHWRNPDGTRSWEQKFRPVLFYGTPMHATHVAAADSFTRLIVSTPDGHVYKDRRDERTKGFDSWIDVGLPSSAGGASDVAVAVPYIQGQYLVAGNDGKLYIWDLSSLDPSGLHVKDTTVPVSHVAAASPTAQERDTMAYLITSK